MARDARSALRAAIDAAKAARRHYERGDCHPAVNALGVAFNNLGVAQGRGRSARKLHVALFRLRDAVRNGCVRRSPRA